MFMRPRYLPTAALLAALVCSTFFPASAVAKSAQPQSAPYVVVFDVGHGGADIGASDASGVLVEKVLTLEIAKLAAADLEKKGYTVYVDRSRDQGVNTPPRDLNHDHKIDHVDEMDARTLFANHHHADVLVSVHFDSSVDPTVHGTHGYYCPARPFWKQSKYLATALTYWISIELQKAGYNSSDNGVLTDVQDLVPQTRADYPWFLVLGPSRHKWLTGSAMPGALIESLFLSSPRDAAALHHTAYLKALAQGYADGVGAYFGWKGRH
jgi:N-acetylmuramoyl-L-alanine amidase